MTPPSPLSDLEFGRCYAAEQIRRSRHPVRRFVKGFYLRQILRDVAVGPCVDFGCGAGQLLERLPPGSVGLEVNPYLIESLRSAGRTVHQAKADMVDFELASLPEGFFRSLVIAHVLEHVPDPMAALQILLTACQRLGIKRVVVVVPGEKGFASDHTHKTFIDHDFLESRMPLPCSGFNLSSLTYFPGPWEWVGRYFVFHEMKVVFDCTPE